MVLVSWLFRPLWHPVYSKNLIICSTSKKEFTKPLIQTSQLWDLCHSFLTVCGILLITAFSRCVFPLFPTITLPLQSLHIMQSAAFEAFRNGSVWSDIFWLVPTHQVFIRNKHSLPLPAIICEAAAIKPVSLWSPVHSVVLHAKLDYNFIPSIGFPHNQQMGNCVSSQSQAGVVEKQAASIRGRSIVAIRKVCKIFYFFFVVTVSHMFYIFYRQSRCATRANSIWSIDCSCASAKERTSRKVLIIKGSILATSTTFDGRRHPRLQIVNNFCSGLTAILSHLLLFSNNSSELVSMCVCLARNNQKQVSSAWHLTQRFFSLFGAYCIRRLRWKSIRFPPNVAWSSTKGLQTMAATPQPTHSITMWATT